MHVHVRNSKYQITIFKEISNMKFKTSSGIAGLLKIENLKLKILKACALRGGHLADIRLGLGLRRYLICFAPLAFVSQRQKWPRKVPSPLVFLMISTHFTAPPSVPLSSTTLKFTHLVPNAEVGPRAFRYDAVYRLHDSLRPVIPDNACTLRITATAGT